MRYTDKHMKTLEELLGNEKVTKKNCIEATALATFTKIFADMVEILGAIQKTLANIDETLKKE